MGQVERDTQKEANKTWPKIARQLQEKKDRWKKVNGPLSATVATMFNIGWTPSSSWQLEEAHHSLFYTAVRNTIETEMWSNASKHEAGRGLEEGVDLTEAYKNFKFLNKTGRHSERAMLNTSLVGACWPAERKFRHGITSDSKCPRCGHPNESLFHRIWECKANEEMQEPTVVSPQHLAREYEERYECFWLRRLVPGSWTQIDPPKDIIILLEGVQKGIAGGGQCFTDGSGGEFSSDRRLRRCGWSVAFVNGTPADGALPTFRCGAYGTVNDYMQTVNRAELLATVQAMFLSKPDEELHIWTDSKFVVRGHFKGKDATKNAHHADVWKLFWQLKEERTAPTILHKVKAHTEAEDIIAGTIGLFEHAGNKIADALAAKGAALNQPSESDIARVRAADQKAIKVQFRQLAIHMAVAKSVEKQKKAAQGISNSIAHQYQARDA